MSSVRQEQRSLGDLFSDLSGQTTRLIHQEIELARTEMSEQAARAAKNGALLAAGGLIAWTGVQILLAAAIIGLGLVIGYGWAALAIGIVVLVAGGVMALTGMNRLKRSSLAPRQTVTEIRETKQWLKRQM